MNLHEVSVAAASTALLPIFAALERALPVRFVHETATPPGSGGKIILTWLGANAKVGTASFVLDPSTGSPVHELAGEALQVVFAEEPRIDPLLRGRRLRHRNPGPFFAVRVGAGDTVLATLGGVPVWTAGVCEGREVETVSILPREIAGGAHAFEQLHGDQFIALLPVFHFLKRRLAELGWRNPPPRACFMFDDPNMHWPTYGFVSYPEIVRRGRATNYHATFATVPLDGWYFNEGTAELFRRNPDRLSFLMHGNNHTYAELAQTRDTAGHLALAAEAMRRIEALETKSRVSISRTMAPPHGACSNATMEAMLRVGIESAYISPWSLRLWDDSRTWPPELGLVPAEMLAEGFAVLPRFKLTSNCGGIAILYAFLGRPIVPVGHHHDLRNGLELLDVVARDINRIPGVSWSDSKRLSRTNFTLRTTDGGRALEVLPYSTRIELTPPRGVTSITLQAPAALRANAVGRVWQCVVESGRTVDVYCGQPFAVCEGAAVTLKLKALGSTPPESVPTPSHPMKAPVRRILCEIRDRCAPAAWRVKNLMQRR
jgi:hypothetical protein